MKDAAETRPPGGLELSPCKGAKVLRCHTVFCGVF